MNEATSQRDVGRYVELSSANMVSSEQSAVKEDCALKPWTSLAQQKEKVEKELEKRKKELNYTVLRLPLVYGKGDRKGLSKCSPKTNEKPSHSRVAVAATRIVIAALYKHLGETMKLLWNQSMKLNTVHVDDVAAAAVELAFNAKANHHCFNVVDDSDSTQGSIANVLADIFSIKVDYWGVVLSNITKVTSDSISS